jgi:hypothetical protein
VSAALWERPGVVGMDALAMANPLGLSRASAWHDPAMASSRVSSLLALEISRSVRRPRVSVELRKSSIASDLTYDLRSGDPDFIDKLVAFTFGNRSAFFASSAATPGLRALYRNEPDRPTVPPSQ